MVRFVSPAVRLFFKDAWTRATLFFCLPVHLLTGLILLRYFPRDENAVLHYNTYFGIDLLGPWYQVLLIPLVGLCLLAINMVLAAVVWRRDRMLSYFLDAGTVGMTVLTTTAAGLILYVSR